MCDPSGGKGLDMSGAAKHVLTQRIGCGDQGGQKIHVLKLRTGCGDKEGAEKRHVLTLR